MTSKSIGDKGERAVKRYLMLRLYRIVASNFRTKHGEIDLIALRGNTLSFIEVKTRKARHTEKFGTAADAVDINKQRHIIYSARVFLAANPEMADRRNIRFDVAEVYTENSKIKEINYIKDAFLL